MRRAAVPLALATLGCSGLIEKKEQVEDVLRLTEMINDPDAYAAGVEQGCADGVVQDCSSLGTFYAYGTYGKDQDYALAHQYMGSACAGGYAYGCHDLGVLYMYGRGVEVDAPMAMVLFEGSCPEVANSCHYLGDYYAYGKDGIEKNSARASEWYQKACDAGSASSCGR